MAKLDPQGKPVNPLERRVAENVTGPKRIQESGYPTPKREAYRERRVSFRTSEIRQVDALIRDLQYRLDLTKLDFTTVNRVIWRMVLRDLPKHMNAINPPTGLKRPSPHDEAAMEEFERSVEEYLEQLLRWTDQVD